MPTPLKKKQIRTIQEVANDFIESLKEEYPQGEFLFAATYPTKKSVALCSCGNCGRSMFVKSTGLVEDAVIHLSQYVSVNSFVAEDVTGLAEAEPPTKAKH